MKAVDFCFIFWEMLFGAVMFTHILSYKMHFEHKLLVAALSRAFPTVSLRKQNFQCRALRQTVLHVHGFCKGCKHNLDKKTFQELSCIKLKQVCMAVPIVSINPTYTFNKIFIPKATLSISRLSLKQNLYSSLSAPLLSKTYQFAY